MFPIQSNKPLMQLILGTLLGSQNIKVSYQHREETACVAGATQRPSPKSGRGANNRIFISSGYTLNMNINILVLISLRNPLAHDIILLYRTNYFIMQNGIFYYAEWNISLCRMEYLLCRMEYFIMQNGIFLYT